MRHVFTNLTSSACAFYDIDTVLKEVKYEDYDWVILTDMHPEKTSVNDLPNNLIILDHHASALHLHNPQQKRFIFTKKCGAALVKTFLEQKLKVDLSQFNELVRLTNDYDLWTHEDPKSWELNQLFDKYKFNNRFKREFADGHTEWSDNEKRYITYRKNLLKQLIDNLESYDFEKIHGTVIQVDDFINECCDYLLHKKSYKLVVALSKSKNTISVRQKLETVDIGSVLAELKLGGGHPKAAGLGFKDISDAENKLEKLEIYLFDNFLDFRSIMITQKN